MSFKFLVNSKLITDYAMPIQRIPSKGVLSEGPKDSFGESFGSDWERHPFGVSFPKGSVRSKGTGESFVPSGRGYFLFLWFTVY